MRHKYLYVECGAVIDDTAKAFQVYVGTSKQANRDFLAITARAASNGHFFQLWSIEVAEFFHRLLTAHPALRKYEAVTEREFVRSFKARDAPHVGTNGSFRG